MRQLYVHGLGQTPDSWKAVLDGLGAPGDCLCPDLAELASGEGLTYSQLYGAFSRYCDGWTGALDLCGLSLGSILALHYAAQRPERVRSLVLIAPQYQMPRRLLTAQNLLFRLLPSSLFPQTGFSKAQFLQLCGSMAELDLSGLLPRVSCPVLVVCGSRDWANRKACAELARLLPRSDLRIVEHGGHELNREAPEQLAALLREFWSALG